MDLRGSITRDENPLGINQYTGAAVHAERASAKAHEASKGASGPIGHGEALKAHFAAYQAHGKARDLASSPKDKQAHEDRMREHENKGFYHQDRVTTMRSAS